MGAMVDIALTLNLKGFLSHRHCQSLLDQWWRGDYANSTASLEADVSHSRVLLWTLVPFTKPHLAEKRGVVSKKRSPFGPGEREELIFSALAQALNLSTWVCSALLLPTALHSARVTNSSGCSRCKYCAPTLQVRA